MSITMFHRLSFILLFGKRLLHTKGGADPTFASAKVKNAIGRIGIFTEENLNHNLQHIVIVMPYDSSNKISLINMYRQ